MAIKVKHGIGASSMLGAYGKGQGKRAAGAGRMGGGGGSRGLAVHRQTPLGKERAQDKHDILLQQEQRAQEQHQQQTQLQQQQIDAGLMERERLLQQPQQQGQGAPKGLSRGQRDEYNHLAQAYEEAARSGNFNEDELGNIRRQILAKMMGIESDSLPRAEERVPTPQERLYDRAAIGPDGRVWMEDRHGQFSPVEDPEQQQQQQRQEAWKKEQEQLQEASKKEQEQDEKEFMEIYKNEADMTPNDREGAAKRAMEEHRARQAARDLFREGGPQDAGGDGGGGDGGHAGPGDTTDERSWMQSTDDVAEEGSLPHQVADAFEWYEENLRTAPASQVLGVEKFMREYLEVSGGSLPPPVVEAIKHMKDNEGSNDPKSQRNMRGSQQVVRDYMEYLVGQGGQAGGVGSGAQPQWADDVQWSPAMQRLREMAANPKKGEELPDRIVDKLEWLEKYYSLSPEKRAASSVTPEQLEKVESTLLREAKKLRRKG